MSGQFDKNSEMYDKGYSIMERAKGEEQLYSAVTSIPTINSP